MLYFPFNFMIGALARHTANNTTIGRAISMLLSPHCGQENYRPEPIGLFITVAPQLFYDNKLAVAGIEQRAADMGFKATFIESSI
jgi:hypothetical protein